MYGRNFRGDGGCIPPVNIFGGISPPNKLLLNKLLYIGESNRIRTVPEYGHSLYLRNHKFYKKCVINKIFIII